MNVPLKDILIPNRKEYVRGTVKQDNLDRMRAALVGKDWPFPPVLLRRLDKPIRRKGTDYKLMVIDGVHRTLIALEAKRKDLPATVQTFSDAEADITQLRLNLEHGMLLDKKHRDAWVRQIVTVRKVKVPQLAKLLHLTERSVFRMLKGEQTGPGAKAKATPKGKKPAAGVTSEATEHEAPPEWSATGFFTELVRLSKEAKAHETEIMAYIKAHAGKLSWLEAFTDLLSPA